MIVGAGACFIAGTQVSAESGNVPIETVLAGDYVWSWNEETCDICIMRDPLMYELIKSDFGSYLFIAIFSGIWFAWGGVYGIIVNTKKIENIVIKRILRVSVSVVCVGFWLWFFVYKNLYPIALAKYEFEHNCIEEQVGTVESVEQYSKDRIKTIIDGVDYTIVYESADPDSIKIGKDIDRGRSVRFRYGKKSKFIFDISNYD